MFAVFHFTKYQEVMPYASQIKYAMDSKPVSVFWLTLQIVETFFY